MATQEEGEKSGGGVGGGGMEGPPSEKVTLGSFAMASTLASRDTCPGAAQGGPSGQWAKDPSIRKKLSQRYLVRGGSVGDNRAVAATVATTTTSGGGSDQRQK